MIAFHSNWTAPFLYKNKNTPYCIKDYEILITILSALKWQQYNGSIKMITDEIGAEFYKNIGIENIWNLGVEVRLDKISKKINPEIFWAAGKIHALAKEKAPITMIDTDFVLWKNINYYMKDDKVAVIHKEEINKYVYPEKSYFKFKNNYKLDEQWNWKVKPCNTALLYIGDENLKTYYVESAIEIMENLNYSINNNLITNMVFAEQRLLSMCAEKMNIQIKEMASLEKLLKEKQQEFTHLWGFKSTLNNNVLLREKFCKKIMKRIINDFPEYEEVLAKMHLLNKYYKERDSR